MKLFDRAVLAALVLGAFLCVVSVFMAGAANAAPYWRIPKGVEGFQFRETDGHTVSPMSDYFMLVPEPTVTTSYVALGAGLYILVQLKREKLS